jgi:hypothetical protein
MVKSANSNAAFSQLNFAGHELLQPERQPPQIAEIATAASTRLRRDLETYHPNNPALAYALVGETHAATLQRWSQYTDETQAALLTIFLEQSTELLRQFQARLGRMVPSNGYMYGQQDEAIKLETQADIVLEEIRRIEAALQPLKVGEALQ